MRNGQSRQANSDRVTLTRSLGLRLPSGHRIESHSHTFHQLVYATEGVMTVETALGSWVVPHHRAVWIPAGFQHSLSVARRVRMRTLYFHPDVCRVPMSCCVVNVAPLLRELILEAMHLGMLNAGVPEHARLAGVLLDQIVRTRIVPLQIKFPEDQRARVVAANAQADLTAKKPISELARGSGASVRTIERLFLKETGMTFGRWLTQVKALHALERLAAGDSATSAGLAVGYDSTSAFIAMFKRILGTTPGRYFANMSRSSP